MKNERLKVEIKTTVKHKGNPRGAGHAEATVIFIDHKGGRHERKVEVDSKNDTKNALTLTVINDALKILIKPCNVVLQLDNEYIRNCVRNGWLDNWQQREWKKANGKVPANLKLWKTLYISLKIHNVKFVKQEATK